jgi:hypothetical protein
MDLLLRSSKRASARERPPGPPSIKGGQRRHLKLNHSGPAIDIGRMDHLPVDRGGTGFWQRVGAALAALARRSGCSLYDSPLPEIREAAQDLWELPESPATGAR